MAEIVLSSDLPDNNRWSNGDIITQPMVRSYVRIIDFWNLKKFRISNVEPMIPISLLTKIGNGMASCLELLNIDHLTLNSGIWLSVGFPRLQELSIGSIVAVDYQNRMLPEQQWMSTSNFETSSRIRFNTPMLTKVYLGM